MESNKSISSSEGSLASFTSTTDEIDGKTSEAFLEELSGDYSRFLNFDVAKEQGKFSESIETMLTKLEEFCGLVDMIRSDTTLCLSKTMPEIQSKCHEMQDMFDRIDRLEAFVGVVKKDVTAMEESVSKAENELTSGTLIKKLSSLVSSKKPASNRPAGKPQFTPTHIFHTERFLGPSSGQQPAAPASPTPSGPEADTHSTPPSAVAVAAADDEDAGVTAQDSDRTEPAAEASRTATAEPSSIRNMFPTDK